MFNASFILDPEPEPERAGEPLLDRTRDLDRPEPAEDFDPERDRRAAGDPDLDLLELRDPEPG